MYLKVLGSVQQSYCLTPCSGLKMFEVLECFEMFTNALKHYISSLTMPV